MIARMALLALGLATHAGAPDSTLSLPGLHAPVRVLTDRHGIPHVQAGNLADLYFAWGFVTARDRLAQLVFLRLSARGEISSVIGNRGLRADGGAQLFELRRHGERLWRTVPRDSPQARALERYCQGINAYIDARATSHAPWPRDLGLVGAKPEHWTPADVMAVVLAQGILLDLSVPQLERTQGESPRPPVPGDSLLRFLDGLSYDTIPRAAAEGLYGAGASGARQDRGTAVAASPDPLAMHALRTVEQIRAGFDALGLSTGGSNVFAVGGTRSARGPGLLANDPHLRLASPGFWHAIHVTVPDTVDAAGMGVPGAPVIVGGRTRDLAWGVTALDGQAMEVYADTLDHANRNVRWKGRWVPLREAPYDLRYYVAGVPFPIPGQVRRYTPHGPVLALDPKRHLAYAVRWAALVDSTRMESLGLERSRTLAELRAHLAGFFTPTLNVAAVDRNGHILYQVVGRMPRRDHGLPWKVTPGGGGHEWSGLIPFERMPSWDATGPGFVANCNNRPVGPPYPFVLGDFDFAADRALRISRRLAGDRSVTAADMASVQNDVYSLEAERLLPLLLAYADSLSASLSPPTRAALDTLRGWDRRALRGRTAPTLFRAWVSTLADSARLTGYRFALLAALDGRAPWLLNAGRYGLTPARAVIQALETARARLAQLLGPDPARWTWDRAHRARFPHSLEWKDGALSPPPVPADGDAGTVCVGPGGLPSRTSYSFGPSYRHIVDLAVAESSWVVVPPGNSGEVGSRHARDMLGPWQNHGYVPLYLSWERAGAARESEWRLQPVPGASTP